MTDARLGMTEGQAADTVLGWCPSMSESTIGFALKKEGQSRETHHPFHRASASPTFRGLPPLSDKGALRILIKPDIAGPISRGDGLCGVKFALPVVLSGLALVPPGPQAQGAGSYFYCQDAAGETGGDLMRPWTHSSRASTGTGTWTAWSSDRREDRCCEGGVLRHCVLVVSSTSVELN
jgi:hypothetical protein